MTNKGWMQVVLIVLTLGGSACVPAQRPDVLRTPAPAWGTAIAITDERVYLPAITVDYPDGWRVVKASEAQDAVQVVFAAPADTMVITVAHAPPAPILPATHRVTARDERVIAGVRVYLQAEAQPNYREQIERHYQRVRASLQARAP